MKKTFFTLLLLLSLITVGYSQTIRDQFIILDIEQALFDFYRIDLNLDNLYDGRTSVHEVELRADRSYKIYAACDGNCYDLDLCIYDSEGNQIDCDRKDDAFPLVRLQVYRSGTFYLKVFMEDCNRNSCEYGIGLYIENKNL